MKKLAAVILAATVALIFAGSFYSAAAYTVNGVTMTPIPVVVTDTSGNVITGGSTTWTCNTGSVAVETQCQPAPGVGSALHVTDLVMSASAAVTIAITSGTGVNCAGANATVLGPYWFAANTGSPLHFSNPIAIPTNTALCCKPSAANGICTINGYTTTP